MKVILWAVIALGAAFGVLYLVVRRAQRTLPPMVLPPGEAMPSTALQRLAWQSLVPIFLLTLAAAAVVAHHGVSVAWENDAVRRSAMGFLIAALAMFTYYISRVRIWIIRDDGTLDERDRAILASAPAGQAPAMMVTLAAWMIGLIETYHASHLVPSVFLYLIFWSLLMVSVLADLAGVVIGYRRN